MTRYWLLYLCIIFYVRYVIRLYLKQFLIIYGQSVLLLKLLVRSHIKYNFYAFIFVYILPEYVISSYTFQLNHLFP